MLHHGPFMVGIAQYIRNVKVSLSFASFSMFMTAVDIVCFCFCTCFLRLHLHPRCRLISGCEVWGPRRCCSTDAETGFVPTPGQFFAVGTRLNVRSPSCTRSCTQKYLVSMCFVRGPAPKRSVKELATELSLLYLDIHWNSRSMRMDLKNSPTWHPLTTAWNSASRTFHRDWITCEIAVHADCMGSALQLAQASIVLHVSTE